MKDCNDQKREKTGVTKWLFDFCRSDWLDSITESAKAKPKEVRDYFITALNGINGFNFSCARTCRLLPS